MAASRFQFVVSLKQTSQSCEAGPMTGALGNKAPLPKLLLAAHSCLRLVSEWSVGSLGGAEKAGAWATRCVF